MGTNYSSSHSPHYEYGFPPRKKRRMPNSNSNHFDKNYLIEGAEFWSERRYREDAYFQTSNRRGRENYAEIYGKAPTEYGSAGVSRWTFSSCSNSSSTSSTSSSSSSSQQQPLFSSKENVAPPPSLRPSSLQQQQHNHLGAPPGIQPKYLPNLG